VSDKKNPVPNPSDARASNGNLRFSPYPPDALEMLEHPRSVELRQSPPTRIQNYIQILPDQNPVTECAYLCLKKSYDADPGRSAHWINAPRLHFMDGSGVGFDRVLELPRIEDSRKAPQRLFHLWTFDPFHVASPDMVDLLDRLAPSSIATLPIDWVFSDGNRLDGYVFVDFIRLHYAYDYKRSGINVTIRGDMLCVNPTSPRVVRDEMPADLQIFRDANQRSDILVTRALAGEIAALASRELRFDDPHTGRSVELPKKRRSRVLKAALKAAQPVVENESMSLDRRTRLRIFPLLQRGAFAEAETILASWLKALPASPYHVIADLQVTTPADACAKYFDDFIAVAKRDQPVRAVYTEMNGFTINPQLWFCDGFAFDFNGGTESFDWLGEFDSATDTRLVITGLESLQQIYALRRFAPPMKSMEDADRLAGSLVIVKFQRLIQQALPLMRNLECPLFASAHDYDEFVVEIRPAGC